jgi:hypothetical protein
MKKSLKIFLFIIFVLILFFCFVKFSVSAQLFFFAAQKMHKTSFAGEKGVVLENQ